jgi:hypothetical protein
VEIPPEQLAYADLVAKVEGVSFYTPCRKAAADAWRLSKRRSGSRERGEKRRGEVIPDAFEDAWNSNKRSQGAFARENA